MASIIDAIEETIHDGHAFIKIFLYTVPVLITYTLFFNGNMGWCYFIGILTLLMLLTVLIKTINNVRNSKKYVLPTFNVFTFCYSSFKAIFAVLPISALCIWAASKIAGIQIPVDIPYFQITYATFVWLILGSIMTTSLIIYSKTEKIIDAYNFNLIQKHCIDILFAVITYVPQIAVFNAIIIGTVAYLLYVFKQPIDHPLLVVAIAVAFVLTVPITGNYFAQVDWEQVTRQENETDTIDKSF